MQANYVMKRKADGTTTIRVLMDNKARDIRDIRYKNSALHRAIIETGRFERASPSIAFRKMISAFCSRSLRDYAISNLNFRLNRRHTSKQLLGEESRKSSKKGPSPIGEDDPQDF